MSRQNTSEIQLLTDLNAIGVCLGGVAHEMEALTADMAALMAHPDFEVLCEQVDAEIDAAYPLGSPEREQYDIETFPRDIVLRDLSDESGGLL